MAEADDYGWHRVARECPHCGARRQTLGTVCPACGKSYEPLGLLERLPLGDDLTTSAWAVRAWVVAALAAFAGLVLLFVRSWVAGTLVLAFLFVALVAAIGISNWMAQR